MPTPTLNDIKELKLSQVMEKAKRYEQIVFAYQCIFDSMTELDRYNGERDTENHKRFIKSVKRVMRGKTPFV
jgi:hypothetical protein